MLLLNKHLKETTPVYAVKGVKGLFDGKIAWEILVVTHFIKLPTGYILICRLHTLRWKKQSITNIDFQY